MSFLSTLTDIGKIGLATIPGVGSYLGAREANKTNQEISSAQTAFQKDMSNTAHQREVADLKAAGLNPILSAGGGGASTPTGVNIPVQNELQSLDKVGSSVMDIIRMRKELQATDASISLQNAQKNAAEKAADLSIASAQKAKSEKFATDLSNIEQSKQMEANLVNKVYDREARARATGAHADSMDNEFRSDHNTFDNIMKRFLPWLGGASSAAQTYRTLKPIKPK